MPSIRTPGVKNVTVTEPAPTIPVHVSSLNGSANVDVLPDSGADISAAGTEVIRLLGDHIDNLLPSGITPKAANGTTMKPAGKIKVKLRLGTNEHSEDLHVYPSVRGMLISWKAAKALGILPESYPQPDVSRPISSNADRNVRTIGTRPDTKEITEEFPQVFDGQIKTMEGEEFHISLTDDAVPFCVNTPRSIPFAYRDKLKSELELLEQQGVIEKVTEATEWCAPIVVTPKKNSERIRLCVDLSRLNRYVRRERYQTTPPAQAVADIAAENAKFFTVIDALKGYHQCPLDRQSQLLTTFITPFGRYKYLRAPYGLSSIAEHYDRRMAEAFEGLSGFQRVVDDVVVYDKDKESHTNRVRQFLQRCHERNVSLNKDKLQFCQTSITFSGFQLSSEGYRVDQSITDAISQFPTPANRSDLRSFGLANQLSSSMEKVATVMSPLRPLLSTKNDFMWTDGHEQAFAHAKISLIEAPTLAFFDAKRKTRVNTDTSRTGLGFVLQQQADDGSWALVQTGSRFLTDA